VDINLPDGSGLDFCVGLRSAGHTTPILMLTANDTELDMVTGLESGADDYVTKPFSLAVLRARVDALLRRGSYQNAARPDGFLFDFDAQRFEKDGQVVELSKTEARLLWLLFVHKGQTLTREQLLERIKEGHVFRKLNDKGKVLIEYAPLETAWVPVVGENYMYIYCLWVAGSFKGKGHGKALLQYCIEDAKSRGKSGVCVISSKKKSPFLSDRKFMQANGFLTVDTLSGNYELLALSFDGTQPSFTDSAKKQSIQSKELTIYYGFQCPYIPNCIEQVKAHCEANDIPLTLIAVDTVDKAKSLPGVFNNWAVYYGGKFETVHMLNEGYLKKLLAQKST
jgi:CheY-like chemotaxis protein